MRLARGPKQSKCIAEESLPIFRRVPPMAMGEWCVVSFFTATVLLSYALQEPGNLKQTHPELVQKLFKTRPFRRMAGHQDGVYVDALLSFTRFSLG